MPKVKPIDLEQRRRITRGIIVGRMERNGLKDNEVALRIHCAPRTFRLRRLKPDSLRLDELWTLCTMLKMTDQEIIQMIRGKEEVGNYNADTTL